MSIRIRGHEALNILKVNHITAYRLIKEGKLTPVKNAKEVKDMYFEASDIAVLAKKLEMARKEKSLIQEPAPKKEEQTAPKAEVPTVTEQAPTPETAPLTRAEAAALLGVNPARLSETVNRTTYNKDYYRPIKFFRDSEKTLWFRKDEVLEYKQQWGSILNMSAGKLSAEGKKNKKTTEPKKEKKAKIMSVADVASFLGIPREAVIPLVSEGRLKSLMEEDVLAYAESVTKAAEEEKKSSQKPEPPKQEAPKAEVPKADASKVGRFEKVSPPYLSIEANFKIDTEELSLLVAVFTNQLSNCRTLSKADIPVLETLSKVWGWYSWDANGATPDRNSFQDIINDINAGAKITLVTR